VIPRALVAAFVTIGCLASPAGPGSAIEAQSLGRGSTPAGTSADVAATIQQAFKAAYNLDESDALALAHRSVAIGPEEPSAHRALATILWLDILFKRGAVVSDQFNGSVKDQIRPKPPADLEAGFKQEMASAIALAETRVRNDPRSLQARYDAASAYALQASYTASVEGSMLSAFRIARRAFDNAEFVLSRDPQRKDAGLIAGTYRYLVSTLSIPARMMAYIAGFGGGKARGIELVEGATQATDTRVDARLALLLIYTREGRHLDALRTARELEAEFPRNRLFTFEAGSAAIRAGRAAEAEATLTKGLAFFDKDDRAKIPGERAFWLYKRGMARISLNHLADARSDLESALQTQTVEYARGRTQLELGKINDLTNQRSEAMSAYRAAKTICGQYNDPDCAAEADRLLRKPFRF
jgi:tetratricopeptide (TPR) repeat protein